jgi:hypothetical protein
MYNLTITKGHSKEKLERKNVTCNCWTEDTYKKDANIIASCLFTYLCDLDLTNKQVVRLLADGCGGQNKNSIMITMLAKWLQNHSPPNITKIELIFPITGHSYLPPDRVFAMIEKKIKRFEVVASPEDYLKIFSQNGTVKVPGDDFLVFDWKEEARVHLKPTSQWHFKIRDCRRVYFKKEINDIHISGEPFYQSQLSSPLSLVKKDKAIKNIDPEVIAVNVHVDDSKKSDVDKLLAKHYGENWRERNTLKYYKHVLSNKKNNETPVVTEVNEEEYCCELPRESCDIRV